MVGPMPRTVRLLTPQSSSLLRARPLCNTQHTSSCPCIALKTRAPRRTLYGYTQAKALVYSQHGEPKEVLQYASHL